MALSMPLKYDDQFLCFNNCRKPSWHAADPKVFLAPVFVADLLMLWQWNAGIRQFGVMSDKDRKHCNQVVIAMLEVLQLFY